MTSTSRFYSLRFLKTARALLTSASLSPKLRFLTLNALTLLSGPAISETVGPWVSLDRTRIGPSSDSPTLHLFLFFSPTLFSLTTYACCRALRFQLMNSPIAADTLSEECTPCVGRTDLTPPASPLPATLRPPPPCESPHFLFFFFPPFLRKGRLCLWLFFYF